MKRCFKKLRGALAELDLGYQELSTLINRSSSYVADRMRGVGSWSLDDCYAILDAIGQPGADLREIFPREVKFNGRMRI